MRIFTPAGVPSWVKPIIRSIEDAFQNCGTLPEATISTLPPATGAKRLIYVSDAPGGGVPAFNDGTYWRRVTDRIIIA